MRGSHIVFLLSTLFVGATLANNLHRALRHHSSASEAVHGGAQHKTDTWIVRCKDDSFVEVVNTHLSVGSVSIVRTLAHLNAFIIEASKDSSADELAALLLSEQRAGRLEWFHRDGLKMRHGH